MITDDAPSLGRREGTGCQEQQAGTKGNGRVLIHRAVGLESLELQKTVASTSFAVESEGQILLSFRVWSESDDWI
jgi:hypothetical protein